MDLEEILGHNIDGFWVPTLFKVRVLCGLPHVFGTCGFKLLTQTLAVVPSHPNFVSLLQYFKLEIVMEDIFYSFSFLWVGVIAFHVKNLLC